MQLLHPTVREMDTPPPSTPPDLTKQPRVQTHPRACRRPSQAMSMLPSWAMDSLPHQPHEPAPHFAEVDDGSYSDNHQYYIKAGAGAQSISWTIASDDHAMVVAAFKVVAVTQPILLANSTYISAGGSTNTTAQLTAPRENHIRLYCRSYPG